MASVGQLKEPILPYGTFSGLLLSVQYNTIRWHGFFTYFKTLTGIEVFLRQDYNLLKKKTGTFVKIIR